MKNNELKIAPTFGAQQEKKMYATESIVQQYEDILDYLPLRDDAHGF